MSTPTGASRAETSLLIAFADLTRFMRESARRSDLQLAEVLDGFYARVAARVNAAGGRVVKFIGDAAFVVFPEDRADEGVRALLGLREEIDRWIREEHGWESRLVVKLHFGTAVAGPFGPPGEAFLDVVGRAVNVAATLPSQGFALSAPAFRKLAPETRRRFKRHVPPITYVPVDETRPR